MIFRELDTVVLERDVPESDLRKGDIVRSFTSMATRRSR